MFSQKSIGLETEAKLASRPLDTSPKVCNASGVDTKMMLSREAMIALKLAGLTYQAIAERTGVSRQRVQQVLAPPPAIAGKVRQASQGLCGQCGKLIGSHGHIHHQGNTSDKWDTLSQLAYLCIACHRGVHRVYPPLNCPVCDH